MSMVFEDRCSERSKGTTREVPAMRGSSAAVRDRGHLGFGHTLPGYHGPGAIDNRHATPEGDDKYDL